MLKKTKNMPKVSVILTSNHEQYLREAIDSILQQTFVDFELIIWDDASGDNSWEIIQSYSDSHIRGIFRNLQHKGAIYGINKAIFEVARGEYIAIHNSDDSWEDNKLELQVNFLEDHQDIGAVFSDVLLVNASGELLTDKAPFYYPVFEPTNRPRHAWLQHLFFNDNRVCSQSILIRKQCYQDCGAYRDTFAELSDTDMLIRLCAKYEIYIMPECLLKLRIFDEKRLAHNNNPATRIRYANERDILLQQYRTIVKQDDIFKIFPDFISYHRAEQTDAEYVLSRVCLESGDSFLRYSLAIKILFDIFNNPARRQAIEKNYGFSVHDFIALTGQSDIFARQQLNQQLIQIEHLSRTAHEQARYIQLIENSLSWKITEPLRKVLGSTSPLGVVAKRSAKWILNVITKKLPESTVCNDEAQPLNTEPHSVSVACAAEKQVTENTQKTQFAHSSSDYCHIALPINDYRFAVPFNYPLEMPSTTPNVAVICHLFYTEMLDEFKHYFLNISFPFDLFITTDSEEKKKVITNSFLHWDKGTVEVRVVPNRGRDIAPKLIACRDVYERYEFFLHIHSKKSLHTDVLGGWRCYLLETLLGSEHIVNSIFAAFSSDPLLGMIAPEHFNLVHRRIGWGNNFDAAKQLANQFGLELSLSGKIDFPSGSMFWGRSAAIKPLLETCLAIDDFPPESEQTDATLAHVIERLYFFVCEQAGYRWIKIACPASLTNTDKLIIVENQDLLIKTIEQTQYGLLKSIE
jgi:glycosyltransferase involved in cell wall biosynthesis